MRTITDATLYTVKGPRGAYYAIREKETGMVLTERTEQAAMAMANERDMIISDRQEISHADLLAMMADRCKDSAPESQADQPHPGTSEKPATSAHASGFGSLARKLFHLEQHR